MIYSNCNECGKTFEVEDMEQTICDKCNDRRERNENK
jgi:Zn finger protein HypA/HybF involved in hydrogenase expression